jgi:hypothetical protein
MNRLVIIGNGFDLAHNMPTSYYDFILNYIRISFNHARIYGFFEDELIDISKGGFLNTDQKFSNFPDLNYFLGFLQEGKKPASAYFLGDTPHPSFKTKWKIKHPFFEKLILVCNGCDWVDIENEYYDFLKEILESPDPKKKATEVESLNKTFDFLIKLLHHYLSTLPQATPIDMYADIIGEPIKKNDVVIRGLGRDLNPNDLLMLNFNYTDTASLYFQNTKISRFKNSINSIHGKINDPSNPIIFGFGDELDLDYESIENEKTPGCLTYIKSFGYFRTGNYHQLIRFVDNTLFQVYILGHSCGLSDRTMLNMIFEHTNCLSIKIFYHEHSKGNNYRHLTQEISRHFKDKGIMRKKIVPFTQSLPMPQFAK